MNAGAAVALALVHTDAQPSIAGASGKDRLANLLAASGQHALAVSVGRCSTEFRALGCSSGHTFNPVPTHRCRYRLCDDCARERQRRGMGRVYPRLRALQRAHRHDRPVLITLTIKSSFEPLSSIHRRFKGWFKNLRRSLAWERRIRGAVAGFEVTWNPDQGWHYHCHILAFRKSWYSQAELAEQWCDITNGAGRIVDIRSRGGLQKMVAEVLKYCFKPANVANWSVAQVVDFEGLRGARLADTYGELRGLNVEDDDDLTGVVAGEEAHEELTIGSPCPDCGEPLGVVTVSRSALREQHARERIVDWMVRNRGSGTVH